MSRLGYVMASYLAATGIGITSLIAMPVKFIWNASASTPIGLYSLHAPHALHVGDVVSVNPSKTLVRFMVGRRYIGEGVPLLKHVAALPGQTVCRTGVAVSIDGLVLGQALMHDHRGRQLPIWQGCRRIAPSQIFLMNRSVRDSFDGRYFGPLPARTVIARATPIYTDDASNGHFVWHGLRDGRS
jgi:conjugative transfer signal peptidase TraF